MKEKLQVQYNILMRLIYFDQLDNLDNFYNWQYIAGKIKMKMEKNQGHTKATIINSDRNIHWYHILCRGMPKNIKRYGLSSSIPNIYKY